MSYCQNITLYGSSSACEQARVLLENHPQVRRLDTLRTPAQLKLILCERLSESDLLTLLLPSGITGLQIHV